MGRLRIVDLQPSAGNTRRNALWDFLHCGDYTVYKVEKSHNNGYAVVGSDESIEKLVTVAVKSQLLAKNFDVKDNIYHL